MSIFSHFCEFSWTYFRNRKVRCQYAVWYIWDLSCKRFRRQFTPIPSSSRDRAAIPLESGRLNSL